MPRGGGCLGSGGCAAQKRGVRRQKRQAASERGRIQLRLRAARRAGRAARMPAVDAGMSPAPADVVGPLSSTATAWGRTSPCSVAGTARASQFRGQPPCWQNRRFNPLRSRIRAADWPRRDRGLRRVGGVATGVLKHRPAARLPLVSDAVRHRPGGSDQRGEHRQEAQGRHRTGHQNPVPAVSGAGPAVVVAGAGRLHPPAYIASKLDPHAGMRRQRSRIEFTASGHGADLTGQAARRSRTSRGVVAPG